MQSRNAFAPVATALLVDLADLITFGPLGLWTGSLLGLVLGWALAPQLGFAQRRWLPALLAGVYCMTPGTAFLPLAAIVTALRSASRERERERPPARGARAIDADYRARWDDEPPGPPDPPPRAPRD